MADRTLLAATTTTAIFVHYVDENGDSICVGSGATMVEADAAAFKACRKRVVELMRRVSALECAAAGADSEEESESDNSNRSSDTAADDGVESDDSAEPSLSHPRAAGAPAAEWDDSAIARASSWSSMVDLHAPLRVLVVGERGTGKLNVCMNLLYEARNQFASILVFSAVASVGDARFCNLTTRPFSEEAFIEAVHLMHRNIVRHGATNVRQVAIVLDAGCLPSEWNMTDFLHALWLAEHAKVTVLMCADDTHAELLLASTNAEVVIATPMLARHLLLDIYTHMDRPKPPFQSLTRFFQQDLSSVVRGECLVMCSGGSTSSTKIYRGLDYPLLQFPHELQRH